MSEAVMRKPRRRLELASNGWCSLNLASVRAGVTRHSLLVSIIAGKLEGQVIAGQVLISEQSLERFIAEREGRPLPDESPAPTA